jgi:hypothetical protein
MANRYWVLGTGSWSSTNTANWSASSGGAGGASVPTAADNVFFDANSNVGITAFTVTMANTPRVCNDFTASGLDGAMTLAGTSIGLTVSGSLTFQATNFTRTYTGTTTFDATTTGKTVTTNGVAFSGAVTFDGVGGGWTLGSAFSCGTNTLTVTNGTFSTSGSNYAVTCGAFSSNNSNIRTINLNASTITLSGAWTFTTSTNLTFNAGTSQINLSGTTATFGGGGLTYRNVTTTSVALVSSSISGANTFNNLTIGGRSSVGISQLTFSSDQTINGTFTVNAGTTEVVRTKIICNPFGTTYTLTCAAVSFTHVDFQDITIAGAASPASGTGLGNAGNNSGITFPAAKTVYYRQTGSSSWGVSGSGSWSLTSGGAADATAFPLAQDTAIFPAATYPASGSTTTINASYFIGTIDMSLRTSNTMTLASSTTNFPVIGNWINGTGITLSGTGIINFEGSGSQTITNAGRTFTQSIQIRSPSGLVTLQDALTLGSTRTFTLTNGTLDLQSFKLSTGFFSSTNSNTRTLAFGTGNIDCTGTGTVWNTSTATGLTTTGTQVVNVTSTGSTAITVNSGFLTEANSISFNFTGGTYNLTFTPVMRNVDFTGFAGTWTKSVGSNIFGNLKLSTGMTIASDATDLTFQATSGTQQITSNNRTINFPVVFNNVGATSQLQDAMVVDTTRTTNLYNGTLDLQSFTLSTGLFTSTNSNARTLAFGTGQISITGTGTAWDTATTTGLTVTGTGTISLTSASAKTFSGGGFSYSGITINQGGAGTLTIEGSNTFGNITNTIQPASILFTAGTTSTFTNFNLSGTSGNLITIGSVTAASHTLSKASGTVSSDFLSISRSTATGGADWYAGANSTNGGNNSGWIFTAPPAPSAGNGNFLVFF